MPSAEGLPDELVKLFKPLCCDLCSAKLNSPSTARLHYESRNHEKKINHWLAGWSERNPGEPIPKRQAVRLTLIRFSTFFFVPEKTKVQSI